jgi:hypothetical protein
MATINWPTTLPHCFITDSFNEALPNNLLRDDYDVGPAGVRPRSSAAVRPISGRLVMTTAQWEIFKDFCADDLLQRSLAFGFPEFGVDPNVSPTPTWLVRIVEPPSRVRFGPGKWIVNLALEILP